MDYDIPLFDEIAFVFEGVSYAIPDFDVVNFAWGVEDPPAPSSQGSNYMIILSI